MNPSIARPAGRLAVLAACLAVPLPFLAAPAAAQPDPDVIIRVDTSAPGRTIPADFLGLSFEANLMHADWIDPSVGTVTPLLRNLGTGNLRFSANQVDNTYWAADPETEIPAWANGQYVTPEDLSRVGALAEATGWSVDMGVNLAHFDPESAADQAAQARQRIGPALRAVEIGNEPNFYLIAPISKPGDRPAYLPHTYVDDARVYREAIRAAAPGVPIEGPNTAGAAVGNTVFDPLIPEVIVEPWLDAYVGAFGAESRYLNQHYYPFINTERVGFTSGSSDLIGGLPSIDKLMSRETADTQTTFIRRLVATAERAGLEPRLSETNSVAKEGKEGVTDSFGAALWTVDYLLTAAREGVAGVNLHNQPVDCESYSLICFADETAWQTGQAQVNPNYYAALMAGSFAGGRVLPVSVESGDAHITAHAARMPDGTVQVAVDDMARDFDGDVVVELVGADASSATAQWLTGPSPEAVDGARYAGAVVGADGTFTPGGGEPVAVSGDRLTVRMNEPSAVLLTVS